MIRVSTWGSTWGEYLVYLAYLKQGAYQGRCHSVWRIRVSTESPLFLFAICEVFVY